AYRLVYVGKTNVIVPSGQIPARLRKHYNDNVSGRITDHHKTTLRRLAQQGMPLTLIRLDDEPDQEPEWIHMTIALDYRLENERFNAARVGRLRGFFRGSGGSLSTELQDDIAWLVEHLPRTTSP